MLQNRVNPYGQIIKTSARGHWMGNRGQLHDENKNLVRPFKLKAWITCLLQFKGWKREVMAPRLYTELFFWDEATSFAAGHRPCFECRRDDYNKFKKFWLQGNKEYGFPDSIYIREIDNILHAQRLDSGGHKVTYTADINTLPNGCFIEWNGQPWLTFNGSIYPWTPGGYGEKTSFSSLTAVKVLTPLSTVNAIKVGYVPEVILNA